MTATPAHHPAVPLRAGLPAWTAVALESFGGPVAQIAVLHRVIVHERRWVSDEQFQRALSFCMLLPGPEAQQLATYLGWRLHGTWGAIVAGSLFVLPGFLVLLFLSLLYVYAGDTRVVAGMLAGLRPAVVAIVAHAIPRLARHVLADATLAVIALGTFAAMYFLRLPFPGALAVAAIVGVLRFARTHHSEGADFPRPRHGARTLLLWLAVWLLPLAVVIAVLGRDHVIAREGRFFATAALITFGGAYAVLTFVAQEAVHRFHWLSASEMIVGLGFAESTPGPLIQVVQWVAFLGAFHAAAPLAPLPAGVLASVLVTWLTFVPSFFFILTLGPYVEALAHNRWLLGALKGISAAVLGAILNLAIWFAIHALFGEVADISRGPLHFTAPVLRSADWFSILLALAVLAALWFRRKHLWLLAASAGAGLLRAL